MTALSLNYGRVWEFAWHSKNETSQEERMRAVLTYISDGNSALLSFWLTLSFADPKPFESNRSRSDSQNHHELGTK